VSFTTKAANFTAAAWGVINSRSEMHHLQEELYYLQQQLEVPLAARERGIIYCKSGAMLLEVPLQQE
jgi:hypothetical protein